MSVSPTRYKIAFSIFVNSIALGVALYVEVVRQLPIYLQLILIAALSAIQSASGSLFDYLRANAAVLQLRASHRRLKLASATTKRQLDELKEIVVSFLEHSDIYRERVKDRLKLREDYICIVKSSEGLSEVFDALETKVMLPFTSVLSRIPGAVRPFERIGLFLIPVRSLPGISEGNIREFVGRKIIPEVERARVRFLRKAPTAVASQARILSFKYMAFPLRRGAIAHDVSNRKFNREFNAFIVNEQVGSDYQDLKAELGQVIRTKDLLALVNWASFAKLNRSQKGLVDKYKIKMSDALAGVGIVTLAGVGAMTADSFLHAVWPVLRGKLSRRKAFNVATKVVDGARTTIDVLRRNGVVL